MTDRWIPLEGCDNARDLGGLPTVDGRTTRHAVLIRCDTLQQLTTNDVRLLVDDYGLRTVLDLRTQKEAAAEGRGLLAQSDVQYHNTAFIPDVYLVPGDPDHKVIVERRSNQQPAERYLDYLTRSGSRVHSAVRLFTQPGTLPALFHCAAGKDRTGVLAALVLDIVGVERQAIVDDYTATNQRLEQIRARLTALPTYRTSARGDIGCLPETMWAFFEAVDQRWGGAAGWARESGVAEEELDILQKTLLD